MKVVIDQDLCEGNLRCMNVAPEVFEVGDDDKARLLIAEPGEEFREQVQRAVRVCPRQAISIEDDNK